MFLASPQLPPQGDPGNPNTSCVGPLPGRESVPGGPCGAQSGRAGLRTAFCPFADTTIWVRDGTARPETVLAAITVASLLTHSLRRIGVCCPELTDSRDVVTKEVELNREYVELCWPLSCTFGRAFPALQGPSCPGFGFLLQFLRWNC